MSFSSNYTIAFLSTYPPRECGLATFANDLTSEIDKTNRLPETKVISISIKNEKYNEKVIFDIQQENLDTYLVAAKIIKELNIDLLCIQHEYGIYGGYCGDFLVDFLNMVDIPIVSTLHTVIPNPNTRQLYITSILGEKSSKVITMAKNTITTLTDTYKIPAEKISFIPHGVPYKIIPSSYELKAKYGLNGRRVVSTFGLISPGKGLEYGIEAISMIAKKHPDVVYLVLGQTHPVVKKQDGENYRDSLKSAVNKLNISDSVIFVDKYLGKDELLEYLKLSDIYMTPYLGKDQAVSGTLAYAVGYGKAIVSTPYVYAKEVLGDGRGLLAEFSDSNSIAECLDLILSNPLMQKELEMKTKNYGKNMFWDSVAESYVKTFIEVINSSKRLVKDA